MGFARSLRGAGALGWEGRGCCCGLYSAFSAFVVDGSVCSMGGLLDGLNLCHSRGWSFPLGC